MRARRVGAGPARGRDAGRHRASTSSTPTRGRPAWPAGWRPDEFRALAARGRGCSSPRPGARTSGSRRSRRSRAGCLLVTTPSRGPIRRASSRATLDPRLVGDDLAARVRIALDDPGSGYARTGRRAARAVHPRGGRPDGRRHVLPRLLPGSAVSRSPRYIPSPSTNGFHIGPLFVHAYGLAYVFAVRGGDRDHAPPLGGARAATPSSSTRSRCGASRPG